MCLRERLLTISGLHLSGVSANPTILRGCREKSWSASLCSFSLNGSGRFHVAAQVLGTQRLAPRPQRTVPITHGFSLLRVSDCFTVSSCSSAYGFALGMECTSGAKACLEQSGGRRRRGAKVIRERRALAPSHLCSNDAHPGVSPRARFTFNHDLHVLIEGSEKAKEPLGGKLP